MTRIRRVAPLLVLAAILLSGCSISTDLADKATGWSLSWKTLIDAATLFDYLSLVGIIFGVFFAFGGLIETFELANPSSGYMPAFRILIKLLVFLTGFYVIWHFTEWVIYPTNPKFLLDYFMTNLGWVKHPDNWTVWLAYQELEAAPYVFLGWGWILRVALTALYGYSLFRLNADQLIAAALAVLAYVTFPAQLMIVASLTQVNPAAGDGGVGGANFAFLLIAFVLFLINLAAGPFVLFVAPSVMPNATHTFAYSFANDTQSAFGGFSSASGMGRSDAKAEASAHQGASKPAGLLAEPRGDGAQPVTVADPNLPPKPEAEAHADATGTGQDGKAIAVADPSATVNALGGDGSGASHVSVDPTQVSAPSGATPAIDPSIVSSAVTLAVGATAPEAVIIPIAVDILAKAAENNGDGGSGTSTALQTISKALSMRPYQT